MSARRNRRGKRPGRWLREAVMAAAAFALGALVATAWLGGPRQGAEAQAQGEPAGRPAAGEGGGGAAAPPAGDPAPTGYTLRDLYDFVASGGTDLPEPGSHALLPPGAPGEGDMPAVEEILALLRARLPCPAAGGGSGPLPDTGQTTCYDGDWPAHVTDCATGACPGQDGFYDTGCPPEGRFVDNGDGTVSDTCTGLMWQKETAPGGYTWCNALAYCEALTLAGHSDWRLPNVRELQSIVDYGRYDPSIDPVFGAESSWYWSSSSYASYPALAWVVSFFSGYVSWSYKDNVYRVRAVRPGP